MRRTIPGFIFALLAGPALAAAPQLPYADFKSWMAACDNTGRCTAVSIDGEALAASDNGPPPVLRIFRDGGSGAAAVVQVSQYLEEGSDSVVFGPFELVIDGPTPARLTLAPEPILPTSTTLDATSRSADANRAFIEAAGSGKSVTVLQAGKPLGTLSLAGSSAALRWIDDRQGRAGGVTALVAKGPAPASAVPAARPLPHVRPAAAVAQDKLPEELPPALAARDDVQACREEEDDNGAEPIIARLSSDTWLYGAPCGRGAYNFSYLFLLADPHGGHVRPAALQGEDGDMLVNPSFVAETMTLSAFGKGRGLGDCGDDAAWVWDGSAFRQTHHAVMSECAGVVSDLWPVVWRAVVD